MMENDWLRGIKRRMDGFEEAVPDGLWEGIESSIDERLVLGSRLGGDARKAESPGLPAKEAGAKAKGVLIPWVRGMVAAAAIVLAALSPLLFSGKSGVDLVSDAATEMSVGKDVGAGSVGPVEPVAKELEETGPGTLSEPDGRMPGGTLLADAREASRESDDLTWGAGRDRTGADAVAETGAGDGLAAGMEEETSIEVALGTGPGVVAEAGDAQMTQAAASGRDDETELDKEYADDSATAHDGEDWSGHLSATEDEERRRRFGRPQLDVSMSGSSNAERGERHLSASQFHRSLALNSSGDALPGGDGPDDRYAYASPVPLSITSADIESRADHKAPLRFGLSVRLPISGGMSGESGLSYSILASTFRTLSGSQTNQDKQVLSFVGVPLDFSVDVFRRRWLSVYASAGAMLEIPVSAKVRSSTSVGMDLVGTPSTTRIDSGPLQWSANAAVGIQLNLFGDLGVYAEPTLSYRFDNGSSIKSVYSERRLDGLVTFGLRYSFE